MGTGQNCTKILLNEDTFARGKKLHEENFALSVSFAGVTVLHESIKNRKNMYIKKQKKKTTKDKLIKQQK